MGKKVTQIREMEVIENEFKSTKIGILAFKDNHEKVNQFIGPFIYADKNIYISFEENDESYEKIEFDDYVSFLISKNDASGKTAGAGKSEHLKYSFIKANGRIKKVEDNKSIEELSKSFIQKYYPQREIDDMKKNKLVMIDTDEIQAMEVINQ